MSVGSEFLDARNLLLAHRSDYEASRRDFSWPRVDLFNWALDYFDVISANNTERRSSSSMKTARNANERSRSLRSAQIRSRTIFGRSVFAEVIIFSWCWVTRRPFGNCCWPAMKTGAVVIPAVPVLTPEDLRDRLDRGNVRHVIAAADEASKFDSLPGRYTRTTVGGPLPAGILSTAQRRIRNALRRKVKRERRTRYCSISRRERPPNPNWCSTHIRAIRSGISQLCIGSGCSPVTCTGTPARRDGPNTPGVPSWRPGMRARRYSYITSLASARATHLKPWFDSASQPCALRRPSGACSRRRGWKAIPCDCAKW